MALCVIGDKGVRRHFIVYPVGLCLEKQLVRLGFTVNSWKEVRSYTENDGELVNTADIRFPKEYQKDGSIWSTIEVLPQSNRYICLMRQPELNFDELWNLYVRTKYWDDELGSMTLIFGKHISKLLLVLTDYLKNERLIHDNKVKLKIKKLGNS
jgi:hypothetical protein